MSFYKFNDFHADSGDRIDRVKWKNGYVFALSQIGNLYIVQLSDLKVINKIPVFDKLLLYDVLDFDFIPNNSCLLLADENNQLHMLPISLHNQHQNRIITQPVVKQQPHKKSFGLWKHQMSLAAQRYSSKETHGIGMHTSSTTQSLPVAGRLISSQPWMDGYRITSVTCSQLSAIVVMSPRNNNEQYVDDNDTDDVTVNDLGDDCTLEAEHNQDDVDPTTKKQNLGDLLPTLVAYLDYHDEQYKFMELTKDSIPCHSTNSMTSMLIVNREKVVIPTFSQLREDLINQVIKYSDIAEAESLCKLNKWSQF